MSGFTRFELSRAQDPDGSKLRGVLTAQFQYERLNAIRVGLAHLLAVGGGFLFLVAGWPAALTRPAVAFGLALLAVAFVAFVIIGIVEYRWYRRVRSGGAPR